MMAMDPVRRILPRFWAGVITMPVLAAVFSAVGVIGRLGWWRADDRHRPGAFWSQMMQGGTDVERRGQWRAQKPGVFGFTVTFIARLQGLRSARRPRVIRTTTRTVVMVLALAVLALDFVPHGLDVQVLMPVRPVVEGSAQRSKMMWGRVVCDAGAVALVFLRCSRPTCSVSIFVQLPHQCAV